MARELSYAEKLVKELAEVTKKERDYENWRWKASTGGLYGRFRKITTVTESSVLGFKSRDSEDRWDEMPGTVAEDFHSFLAQREDEAYRRKREIQEELEKLK